MGQHNQYHRVVAVISIILEIGKQRSSDDDCSTHLFGAGGIVRCVQTLFVPCGHHWNYVSDPRSGTTTAFNTGIAQLQNHNGEQELTIQRWILFD